MINKLYEYFAELLLSFIFVSILVAFVHLIHKSDAGGNDAVAISCLQTLMATDLGALTTLIMKKAGITVEPKKPDSVEAPKG